VNNTETGQQNSRSNAHMADLPEKKITGKSSTKLPCGTNRNAAAAAAVRLQH